MLHMRVLLGKGHRVLRAGLSAADVALRPGGLGRQPQRHGGAVAKPQRVSVVCSSPARSMKRAMWTPIMWCTWYKNPCFALHTKRTQHGQLRSIAVCCGQPKTPITLHQFAKSQVGKSGLVIARFFAKVRVAGSNPVVRSKERPGREQCS